MRSTFTRIFVFALGGLLFLSFNPAFAWTGPTQSPPSGNTSAPINVGNVDQVKNGGFSTNNLIVYGSAFLSGASKYLNFGTTPGSSGYGIRDNAGEMEVKNSNYTSWYPVATTTATGFPYIRFADGTRQTTAGAADNLGNHTATQALNMGTFKITSLGTPTVSTDAATKAYVDSASAVIVPTGAVVAFALTACPTGWSEYTPAYGRFIRGIDKSGTSIDPSGQRAVGNIQNDDFETHTHTYIDEYFNISGGSHQITGGSNDKWNYQVTRTSDARGGAETRPKNVALLYCVKS